MKKTNRIISRTYLLSRNTVKEIEHFAEIEERGNLSRWVEKVINEAVRERNKL